MTTKKIYKKAGKKGVANTQNIIIAALAIGIASMAIGFAAYTAQLSIGGSVTVKPAKWDIHWQDDDCDVTSGSVTTGASCSVDSETAVSFSATLAKPGDFYEFTVNAENKGSFDAKLTGIMMSSIADYASYLTYTVTYDNTPYTASASGLSTALDVDAVKPVKVKVQYIQPADSSSLPTSDVTVNLTAAFDYAQVE